MRHVVAAAVVVVALAGFSVNHEAPAATVSVKVDLRCTPNGVSYTVEPWTVTLHQGDEVEWTLDPGASTDELEIRPKQVARWPFATRNFRGGRNNNRPHGRGMRPGQRGTRHTYNVMMVCNKGPVTRPDTVMIDPEIIID